MKKINTKLNGVNHRTSGLSKLALHESTMMVGADVTHPSPDNSEVPSVAAVTASWDKYAFRYMMEYNVQPPRMEIIQNFENMMINMLKNFESKNSTVPKKIIFYRDGVSDGQFSQVLNTELLAMRRACFRSFGDGYRPAITFVVVQKRHHARFFPLDKKNATHKTMNVPPGTCVDTNITHPTEMDFYLLSHSSIQGTARPTKYHVLYDDNDFSADDLQKLTFDLCHLFSRCDRAVSYPAPTYYAHLAAFRAKNYLEGKRFRKEELSNVSKYSDLINYDIKKNYPMFFV